MDSTHFSLRWSDYLRHVTSVFDDLRNSEDLVDVTLHCQGKRIKAHKILLSACSSYFRQIFNENPCQHPVIIFRNVQYDDLLCIVNFMYHGEVSVLQEQLASFLTTAELLEVRGLTNDSEVNDKQNDQNNDVSKNPDHPHADVLSNSTFKSKRRKISANEDHSLNSAENHNAETISTDRNLKFEQTDVNESTAQVNEDRQTHSDNLNYDNIVLESEDVDTCDTQCTIQFKTSVDDLPIENSMHTPVDQETNESSTKDISQGIFNWKVIPLQANDILPENIFASVQPSPSKQLIFDSKLEIINKNKVLTNSLNICNVCDKVFKHPDSLTHHKKVHKEEIICKICSKAFSRQYNLIRHMKTSHSLSNL